MGPQIQLSDFVGDHGPYQLYITVLLFVRYVFLGLMANSGPLMTPDVTFYCQLPMDEIVAIMPNISLLNQTEQELEIKEEFKRICQLDLHLYHQQAYLNATAQQRQQPQQQQLKNPLTSNKAVQPQRPPVKFNTSERTRECLDFTYEIAQDQGRTMTSEFDLVCDRDWLRSLFQSLISASIVVAHVFWGTFSDKYGRFKAQKLCLMLSLLAGGLSVIAVEFWTFVVARALCSFGDLGLVVSLTTTVVELVGNQYRGLSVAIVNFGSALGVTIFPYIVAYFEDFRKVVAFTVLCHVVTMPFLWTNNESIRWLLTNRKFNSAKRELKRIRRWNRKSASVKQRVIGVFGWRRRRREPEQLPEPADRSTSEEEKRISAASEAREKKEKFELLFVRFIDQIESQNFCDPLGANRCTDIESAQPSDATDASMDCNPALVSAALAQSPVVPHPPTIHWTEEPARGREREEPGQLVMSREKSASACRLNMYQDSHSSEKNPKDTLKLPTIMVTPEVDLRLANSFSSFGRNSNDATGDLEATSRVEGGSKLENSDRERHKSLWVPLNIAAELPSKKARSATIDVIRNREASLKRQPHHRQQPDCINLVASQLSFMGRVNRLFRDKQLMIAVFTIVWTTFNSELQYTSFIIINLEVGEDVYLNYILGGCMEALAAIIASILLSYASRRHTLITFWLLISFSCFGLSVAHIDSTWAVWLLALAKFSQSCLSSVASVAAYESFPTFLRQSGSGLVFTLGMLGSVFAPLIFAEFDDQVGMDRVLMTFSFSSLTAATLIYLYLKETRNCELQ